VSSCKELAPSAPKGRRNCPNLEEPDRNPAMPLMLCRPQPTKMGRQLSRNPDQRINPRDVQLSRQPPRQKAFIVSEGRHVLTARLGRNGVQPSRHPQTEPDVLGWQGKKLPIGNARRPDHPFAEQKRLIPRRA